MDEAKVKSSRPKRKSRKKAGIALLISIFILLLICVIAIALIVSSGTETALAGNYRSSTGVYYAAYAGLEEARGRLSPKDPNTLKSVWSPPFYSGTPVPIGTFGYVLNPGPGEIAGTILTTYPDTEYTQEFPSGPYTTITTPSVWNMGPLNALSFPGPLYKWVRINAVSEKSTGIDADSDGHADDISRPLFYNGAQFTFTASGNSQVFEITSLAVSPNASGQNSQKLVQYLVATTPITLPPFNTLAAITLVGNPSNTNPAYLLNYGGPDSTTWFVNGQDSFRYLVSNPPSWSCTPTAPTIHAIGYTNSLDNSYGYIHCCKVTAHANNYTGPGSPGTNPDVHLVTMPAIYQTPTGFNSLVQTITQNADVVITPGVSTTPPYTSYATADLVPLPSGKLPSVMGPDNPLTVVVNGNLDFTAWHNQGYGLLLVTGNLNYDPDASWYGIVLVIGKGTVTGSRAGAGEFDGVTMLAQTVDPSTGTPLVSLGGANMQFVDTTGGVGYYYSSCWINNSIPTSGYKILSFHEIAQ